MTPTTRSRFSPGPRLDRPAVVEHVGSPQSTSDGRATIPSLRKQATRFAVIGLVSTVAWAGLFSLLRGAGLGSVPANAIALVLTAIANTAANRRFTFARTGRDGLARDHGAGLLAFVVALGITTMSATLLARIAPHAARLVELAVLGISNAAATGVRFALLRSWILRPRSVAASRRA